HSYYQFSRQIAVWLVKRQKMARRSSLLRFYYQEKIPRYVTSHLHHFHYEDLLPLTGHQTTSDAPSYRRRSYQLDNLRPKYGHIKQAQYLMPAVPVSPISAFHYWQKAAQWLVIFVCDYGWNKAHRQTILVCPLFAHLCCSGKHASSIQYDDSYIVPYWQSFWPMSARYPVAQTR